MKWFSNWKLWHKIVYGLFLFVIIGSIFSDRTYTGFDLNYSGIVLGYWFGIFSFILISYLIINFLANRKFNLNKNLVVNNG